ncbi:G-type lectin S-receptor-like serine/threonine-protein kinase At4g27290 isoform X2 [Humulus lupulus]|uniref:G-type lectin S-receptor-like serine/threonine-protein kinase At4g27290 isoform X2 n=1 Tax=Humulus lupulus TaxID=3486 RepID=UPI002B40E481|nr:G-type lectin S-receptor-like serine/threonine-protein kinase At4g27290 isoform X2 [Humulus lupulus]
MKCVALAILLFLISIPIFLKPVNGADDTISLAQPLTDRMTLVSSGQIFELGFFSPGSSKNRYLGIWYKTTPHVVVWVANRNNPLTDFPGELAISSNSSQLLIRNQSKAILWSSMSSGRVAKNPVAQLLDTGNLVLRENDSVNSELYLWQSFDYPSDTLLSGMKLGWDLTTGLERYLTSWKSIDDPSTGDFTYKMNITGLPQTILAMGSTRQFRSGPWNGVRFSGLSIAGDRVFKSSSVFTKNESYYMFTTIVKSLHTRVTMNTSGSPQRLILQNGSTEWNIMYSVPYQRCDSYGFCGANGVCGVNNDPLCKCLEGFIPTSPEEWQVLDWSNGCKRKNPLKCQRGEGFAKLDGVKLPDLLEFWLNKSMDIKECKEQCLNNCSCTAYADSDIRGGGSGCLMWFGDLIDIRELRVKGSDQKMYLRLSAADMKLIYNKKKKKKMLKMVIVISTTSGMCLLLGVIFWCTICKSRKRVRGQSKNDYIELPMFDMATIAAATNNFSDTSRIGEGGFGPVYKGNLSTGQEIAVKRLSKDSGQGLEEFKNEVVLISKLQHRNLVGLLGCCIEGEERMLIYEYMYNKSLNHFIFGENKNGSLDWKKRFDIIMGIARGLLYLHQDSKLQIIHRDLKASNILLDMNMNPKISDFGLARIFGGGEIETKTRRIVGTYGYISPEYAVDGNFSIKSDVFSFGVVLLEIISGKRNRGFSHSDHHHNLLGHAWLLWNKELALEIKDSSMEESMSIESQVLRCIQVGLLCVQKFPADRPTMASVVVMLSNERAELPWPKEPAFFLERSSIVEDTKSREEELYSPNETSTTLLEGR